MTFTTFFENRFLRWFIIIILNLGAGIIIGQKSDVPILPWDGRMVFNEKGCIQCHAIYGRGGDRGADLGEDKFYGSYLDLASLMWNHFPEMYEDIQEYNFNFPEFTSSDMKQLVAYLFYSRFLVEPKSNDFRGRKMLRSKGCFDCHKFGGEGGEIGPEFSSSDLYFSPVAIAELMWNHGPAMMDIFKNNKIDRPEIDDDEMEDLTSGILSYMRPTRILSETYYLGNPFKGKKLSESKGCMQCHSFRGVGGKLGPDFDEVDFNYTVIQIAGKMWNHGPKMWEIMVKESITFPVFKKGEMADVIAYMYYLKLEDEPGDIEKGSQIISQIGCLSCHSVGGKNSENSIDFSTLPGMDASLDLVTNMWNHAPNISRKLKDKKIAWPELSSRDMANIHTYLQSIRK
jgi:mono/diheme cytochrome c family protein